MFNYVEWYKQQTQIIKVLIHCSSVQLFSVVKHLLQYRVNKKVNDLRQCEEHY